MKGWLSYRLCPLKKCRNKWPVRQNCSILHLPSSFLSFSFPFPFLSLFFLVFSFFPLEMQNTAIIKAIYSCIFLGEKACRITTLLFKKFKTNMPILYKPSSFKYLRGRWAGEERERAGVLCGCLVVRWSFGISVLLTFR